MRTRLERTMTSHGLRWPHVVLLGLFLLVPFVNGAVLVSAPYGDSHDGRNGSIWADGAERLRADPFGSRLGAERADGWVYATHPPAILTALAVAETAAGDHPATDRALVLAGTLTAIVLSFALLLACRFRPWAALVGVLAMVAAPLLRAYGSMVDTPMLGFPLAVAIVLVVVRLDERERPRWWELAVFVVAPLVSWQLVLLVGMVLVGLSVDRRRRRHLLSVAGAACIGGVLTGAWLLWANGGAGPIVDQWLVRSSVDSEVGLRAALDTQWGAAMQLLGPLMLVLPATLLLRSGEHRRRWAVGLAAGVVVLYCVLLSDGAAYHDYWAFWVLLPVALGAARLAELLDRALRSRHYPDRVRVLGLVALLGAIIVPGLVRTSLIEDVNVSSAAVSDVISAAQLAEGQDTLWALAEFGSATCGWRSSGFRSGT